MKLEKMLQTATKMCNVKLIVTVKKDGEKMKEKKQWLIKKIKKKIAAKKNKKRTGH